MSQTIADKVKYFFGAHPQHVYKPGEVIIQAGREPAGVNYLLEGHVIQYDIAPNGNKIIVNIFKPGAFFPMSWAINNTPNRYFFETPVACMAQVAPAAAVVSFLHDNPDVAYDLLSRVYRGSDGVLRRLAHLMGGNARTRLLFELANSGYRFGQPDTQGTVLPLRESDLAQRSGLTRETVNRTLHALQADKLVNITSKGIVIPSLHKLEETLGDDL